MTNPATPTATRIALTLATCLAAAACSQRGTPAPQHHQAPARATPTPPAPEPARPSDSGRSPASAAQPVAVGQRAPDFALASTEGAGQTVRLSEALARRTVILAFFPRAFTPG